MASHFSTLGFSRDDDTIGDIVRAALKQGRRYESEQGIYIFWQVGAGVEIWLHFDPHHNTIMNCEPHFSGSSRITAKLDSILPTVAYPMEGKFHLWMSGGAPFVCSIPDFRLALAHLTIPQTITLQVAAFAQQLTYFADKTAFATAQGDATPKFSANYFIPTGLFTRDAQPPRALARFAGTIQSMEQHINPATNGTFLVLHVTTFIGPIDIVADEELLTTLPAVGGVIVGDFWLSGRVKG